MIEREPLAEVMLDATGRDRGQRRVSCPCGGIIETDTGMREVTCFVCGRLIVPAQVRVLRAGEVASCPEGDGVQSEWLAAGQGER